MRAIGLCLLWLIWGMIAGSGGAATVMYLRPEVFRAPPAITIPLQKDTAVPKPNVDIRPFVVQVQGGIKDSTMVKLGHGVAWDETRIVTNAHVVKETPSASAVKVLVNGKWISATRVVWSTSHDVALIEFSKPHGVPIAGMRGMPAVGTPVFYYNTSEKRVLTGAVVSASEVTIESEKFATTSLPSRSGDSGGPVFDAGGNVLGLVTRAAVVTQGADPGSYMLGAQLVRQVMVTLVNYQPAAED
ncbi:MAG: hypothetical protein GC134_09495 [Proteobacteria bacterium]|nr:hypothetical protein [Pseudomonadota bacterium]